MNHFQQEMEGVGYKYPEFQPYQRNGNKFLKILQIFLEWSKLDHIHPIKGTSPPKMSLVSLSQLTQLIRTVLVDVKCNFHTS